MGEIRVKGIRATRSEVQLDIPLMAPLFEDLVECEELLNRADTQFARRTFVRAAFAFTEAFSFWFRQTVEELLIAGCSKSKPLEVTKLELLSEVIRAPDGNGKLEPTKNRIPFRNSLAFVIRTAAECKGADPELIFSDNGWREMRKALDTRHRITHPKIAAELQITDDDMDSVRESHRWLMNAWLAIAKGSPTQS
jgi:hypothetical protein